MVAASFMKLVPKLISAVVALSFASGPAAATATAGPIVTQEGLVEGVEEDGVRVFKGIPFAAPPVGDLRWRAPAPPAPWPGVLKADRFSPICVQRGAYPEDSPPESMSEDCLTLNIWAPSDASNAPLPVMVWIYGGGLRNGSASTPLYAGDGLARRGVIVVTVNYRLGVLGFLAHPELTAESRDNASGNYGLLDQIAALAWVNRNIAAFGGDPDNVTVFGQSSGSISISALIASPLARGLFHRAIGQSGGLFEPLEASPEFKLKGAEEYGLRVAERLGAASLRELRALPADVLAEARFGPQPNIDGYVLLDTPYAAYQSGAQNSVDVLIGSNAEEGLYFQSGREIRADNLTEVLNQDFPSFIVSLIGPKAQADDAAARAAFVAFEGDMRFGWNMWAWARLQAGSGKGDAYFYRFGYKPPGAEGATHGAELPFVFDHLPAGSAPADQAVADLMAAYWTNFAKTGDPNGAGLPAWPKYSLRDGEALLIGEATRAGAIPGEDGLKAIDALYRAVRLLMEYGIFILGAVAAGVVLLLWKLISMIARPRRKTV